MSNGVIAYRSTTRGREYLMIRRKDSLGYVDFMRGKYSLNDRDHLRGIIDEMSMDEKKRILTTKFDTLWGELWGHDIGAKYRIEQNTSRDKFSVLRSDGTLTKLVNESTTKWTEPEWGFPKGRRNYLEKDLECAVREFSEETGYTSYDIEIVFNVVPFEEIFTGSNYKSYKHCYYLAHYIGSSSGMPQHQTSEVGKLEWKTYDDCIDSIRAYNLEKIEMMLRIERLLNKYKVYK
jgi:8-oxo-dGTP pyrophosphatase MutT (NUDIX family)